MTLSVDEMATIQAGYRPSIIHELDIDIGCFSALRTVKKTTFHESVPPEADPCKGAKSETLMMS